MNCWEGYIQKELLEICGGERYVYAFKKLKGTNKKLLLNDVVMLCAVEGLEIL